MGLEKDTERNVEEYIRNNPGCTMDAIMMGVHMDPKDRDALQDLLERLLSVGKVYRLANTDAYHHCNRGHD